MMPVSLLSTVVMTDSGDLSPDKARTQNGVKAEKSKTPISKALQNPAKVC